MMGSSSTRRWLAIASLALLALSQPASASSSIQNRAVLPKTSAFTNSKHQILTSTKEIAVAPPSSIFRGGQSNPNHRAKEIGGVVYFVALDHILRKIFSSRGISFPSMMAGCVLIFGTMVSAEFVKPGLGDAAFDLLNPGAGFLAKWLPSFFVPGLAMLPHAPSVGSAAEVAKVVVMIVLGFFFTTATTAFSVLGIRSAQGKVVKEVATPPSTEAASSTQVTSAPRVKAFPDDLLRNLATGTAIFGAATVFLTKSDNSLVTPVRTLFMLCASIGSYVYGANLSPSITKILHPTLTSTFGAVFFTYLLSRLTKSTFLDTLKTYKVGSFEPMKTGAGDLILHMLGPTVCSLSIAMYSRKTLLKENLAAVLIGVLVSATGGLFGTALFVRLINLKGNFLRFSVLSRNVTAALSMAIAEILGGNISIAASVVVVTGIFGATVGARFLDKLGIQDAVSRGLGMGAGAQGLGVAAMVKETDAFPFAAMSMILTALCASSLVSIPVVRDYLKDLALGR